LSDSTGSDTSSKSINIELDQEALTGTIKALTSNLDFNSLLTELLNAVTKNSGATRVVYIDIDGEDLQIRADKQVNCDVKIFNRNDAHPVSFDLPAAFLEKCLSGSCEYVLENIKTETEPEKEKNQKSNLKSILVIPLTRQQSVKGLVYLENNLMEDAFRQDHVQFLSLLAGQAAIAIENALVFKALQESGRLLSETQDIANIGSWEWDLKTGKATWSEQLYHIYGMDPGLDLPPMESYLDIYHPDDRKPLQEAIDSAIINDIPYKIDYRINRRNDGETRWIRSQGQVEKDAHGKPERLLGIAQDITHRKEAEEKIETSLKEKEILLREVHHRVKNNMQIIISLLELQMVQSDKDIIPILNDITGRIRIFSDIQNSLYQHEEISQLDFANHLKINFNNLMDIYRGKIEHVDFNIDIVSPLFDLDIAVPCGLLMNELMTNSFKHAFTGKGEINISISLNSSGEIKKVLYYDNGKGMENYSEGFGSTIIKAVSMQLGLDYVISTEGPAKYEFNSRDTEQITGKPSGKILYVEDEILIAMGKIADLRRAGYTVDGNIITTGEKALQYVNELNVKPSLIIMDIRLDGKMDGISAAIEIRKKISLVPIIFITGYEDPGMKEKISNIPN